VRRGPIRESLHVGCGAEVDDAGDLRAAWGDPEFITTLRSAAKPLQAVPLVLHPSYCGLGVRDEELAIGCASHPGLPRHCGLAASLLALSGFVPDDLVCGPAGNPPVPLKHGCSGNHAAILLLAKLIGAPLEGYEQPDHPAQRAIREQIAAMAGGLLPVLMPTERTDMEGDRSEAVSEPEGPSLLPATDGCGIPTFGMRLRDMARAFAALTRPDAPWADIPRVMGAYPELIGAEEWIDVRLMQVTQGRVVAKTGAEGLLCLGMAGQGRGMAIKVLDGGTRALGLMTIAAGGLDHRGRGGTPAAGAAAPSALYASGRHGGRRAAVG
jgi:L-asparaginase II